MPLLLLLLTTFTSASNSIATTTATASTIMGVFTLAMFGVVKTTGVTWISVNAAM